ncbi:MAG: LysR family transcriptional regulator [Pseudomonadota bacterium]
MTDFEKSLAKNFPNWMKNNQYGNKNLVLMDDLFTLLQAKYRYRRASAISRKAQDMAGDYQPLLFEMLRSFTVLAKHLNLSEAVAELGSTRQTVRRHIAALEAIRGGPLFDMRARQYRLTPRGEAALPEASDLLVRSRAWADRQTSSVDGLQRFAAQREDGWFFHLQQHPLLSVADSSSPLFGAIFSAWARSGGRVEDDEFRALRPHTLMFRKLDRQWLFIEVGEKSGFAKWVGVVAARSSIGRPMVQMPNGHHLEQMMLAAYESVDATGHARYDHIFTTFPRGAEATITPLAYERMLLAVRLPDESRAVLSVTRPTYDLDIQGIDQAMLKQMPNDLLM